VALSAKENYLIELFKAQYETELKEAQGWIEQGKVMKVSEYPIYIDLSIDKLDEFFQEGLAGDEVVTLEMLIYEIGKEVNVIYEDAEDDSHTNRCNYACTLYEMYKDRVPKATL
jgi:hypothetical protein